jgi:hypothetical protein
MYTTPFATVGEAAEHRPVFFLHFTRPVRASIAKNLPPSCWPK